MIFPWRENADLFHNVGVNDNVKINFTERIVGRD